MWKSHMPIQILPSAVDNISDADNDHHNISLLMMTVMTVQTAQGGETLGVWWTQASTSGRSLSCWCDPLLRLGLESVQTAWQVIPPSVLILKKISSFFSMKGYEQQSHSLPSVPSTHSLGESMCAVLASLGKNWSVSWIADNGASELLVFPDPSYIVSFLPPSPPICFRHLRSPCFRPVVCDVFFDDSSCSRGKYPWNITWGYRMILYLWSHCDLNWNIMGSVFMK